MTRKILELRIHANERGRATALVSMPFILPLFGLLFVLMTQVVAGHTAPPSSGGASPPQAPLKEPTFDLQISKTDGVRYVTPGTVITYTIYYANAFGTDSPEFYVIENPSSDVTVSQAQNTEWAPAGGGDWRYPATHVITLTSGQSLSTTFTVSVPLTTPYGTQLDNSTTFSVPDADDATPEDNRDTDTDIVVPGFNFSHLPLVTKPYAP